MKVVAASEPLPELSEFLAPYAHHFVRSETRENLERDMTGHLSDIPRKNGDTIAQAVPQTSEQRLQELLTRCVWDEAALNTQRGKQMRDTVRLSYGVLIFDDTGFPKQGKHSVGVARQYCGCLGKVANCQVVVTCVYADAATHWPVNVQLYLPSEWTDDKERCARAGVPDKVTFQTKPQIALALLDYARSLFIPHSAVIADSNYEFTDAKGLRVAMILSSRAWRSEKNDTSQEFHVTFTSSWKRIKSTGLFAPILFLRPC